MTLETINKALQHPHKIRNPTDLTLKSITDATIANLTQLKVDATAKDIKIASMQASLTELRENQANMLAPLEAEAEDLRLQLSQSQAELVFEREENAEKEKQIVAFDGAVNSFVTGLKAMTAVYNEQAKKGGKAGAGLPSPARLESPMKLQSPTKSSRPTKAT